MMPDREKVIKALQIHADGCGYRSHHCDAMECPYRYGDESCDIEEMCRDALAMLKQEAVEPSVSSVEQRCGNCNKVIEMDGWKACPWCGKPIDWEGWWIKNGTHDNT
jgi:hypothetical protein